MKKMMKKMICLLAACSLVLSANGLIAPTAWADISPISSLSLAVEGNLAQTDDNLQNVAFTAAPLPGADVDESTIEWYVDHVKQAATGRSFVYKPVAIGNYIVEAKVSNNATATTDSKIITVTNATPVDVTYLTDAFDGYGGVGINIPTTCGTAKWTSTATSATNNITTVLDPKNANNIAAKFWSTDPLAQGISMIRKTIPAGGNTIVVSGKVLLSALNSSFLNVEIKNGASNSYTQLCSFYKNTDGRILLNSGATTIAKAKANQWIKFDICLVQHATDPTQCQVTGYFSGGVTAANGSSPIAVTATAMVNLSAINYLTTAPFIQFRGTIPANTSELVYIDDIKIIQPSAFALSLSEAEVAANDPVVVNFSHDINLLTLDKTKVSVTQANGEAASIASLEVNPLSPNYMILHFVNPLDANTAYTIATDNSVLDVAGHSASNSVSIHTAGTAEPVETITALSLNTPHNLDQTYGATEPINFNATTAPATSIDEATIAWYVNDILQPTTGKIFTCTPSDAGSYVVSAKVTDNPSASIDSKTITVANANQNTPAISVTKTKNSVTITPVLGAEYALKLKSSTEEIVYGQNNVFDNLAMGTEYTATTRLAAKTNYNASPSVSLDVTTDSDTAYVPISSIILSASGSLDQVDNNLQNVVFTAAVQPSINVDVSTVEWYVNSVKQAATGISFTYKPTVAGNYKVEAKVSNNASAETEYKTITVTSSAADSAYLTDSFDQYGGANVNLPVGGTAKWTSLSSGVKANVTTAYDPLGGNNMAVKFWSTDSISQYLMLRKSVPALGNSLVISGKVLLTALNSPGLDIMIRDATVSKQVVLGSFAKSVDGKIIVGSGYTAMAKAKPNQWINFNLCLTTNADPTKCTVTGTFSGGVTATDGSSPASVTSTATVDLTGINYLTASPLIQLRGNLQPNSSELIYIDDMKIYQPKSIQVDPAVLRLPLDFGLECIPKYAVYPLTGQSEPVSWESSDSSVATVNPSTGNITPLSVGTANITARLISDNTVVSNICMVTVVLPENRGATQKLNVAAAVQPRFDENDYLAWPTAIGDAKVALWSGNKTGVVTLSADDAVYSDFDQWLAWSRQYGYKFTFFVPTQFIGSGFFDNAVNLPKIITGGQDIQSKTKTNYSDVQQSLLTSGQKIEEYAQPFSILSTLSGVKCKTIAFPYGVGDTNYSRKYYIAARGASGDINPAATADYGNISSRAMSGDAKISYTNNIGSDVSLEGMIKSLYDTGYTYKNKSNIGGWASLHSAGLGALYNNADLGSDTSLKKVYDYLFEHYLKPAEDKLWVGSFTDVAMYAQERDTQQLTIVKNTSDEIQYTLTDEMDDVYFDYPLTVKIRIDNSWGNAVARQQGKDIALTLIRENGNQYVMVETVPDKGIVSVKPELTAIPDNLMTPTIIKSFPDGKMKAVTASFDDGTITNDKRLIDMFNRYSMKGTFNLRTDIFTDSDKSALKILYSGHEVATHTQHHTCYDWVSPKTFYDGMVSSINFLKDISDRPIRGLAYPNGGSAGPELKEMLKSLGIEYARNTFSTEKFYMPNDFYNWAPTAFELGNSQSLPAATTFVNTKNPQELMLYEVWGHTYQMTDSLSISQMEQVCATLANRTDTWYATNIDIVDYSNALKQLIINPSDTSNIYNPSDLTVCVKVNDIPVSIAPHASKTILATSVSDANLPATEVSVLDESFADAALVASAPASETTDVELDAKATLVFNKAMDPATVTASNITINNGAVIQSITMQDDNKVAVIQFEGLLNPNTNYTLGLAAGITDENDVAILPVAVNFKTKNPFEGTLTDQCTDFRNVYEKSNDLTTCLYVNNYDISFRTSSSIVNQKYYVVYKAPAGDLTSFRLDTLRIARNVPGDFKVSYSSDNVNYTPSTQYNNLGDVALGGPWQHLEYYADSLPAGTKYLKIEFPTPVSASESGSSLIGNVSLSYKQTDLGTTPVEIPTVRFQNISPGSLTEMPTIVTNAHAIGEITSGMASFGLELRNTNLAESFKPAKVAIHIYKQDSLIQTITKDITIPLYGESTFIREEVSIPTVDTTQYSIKAVVLDPSSDEKAISQTAIIDSTGIRMEGTIIAAPNVTLDDIANTITGMDLYTMEYALSPDGGATYGNYTSDPLPGLGGNKTVKVRMKAVGQISASLDTILTFTPNAGDVSADGVIDVADVIMAAEIAVGNANYTTAQVTRANVSNKSAPLVDIADVVMIAERAVGGTAVFPVERP